MERYFILGGFNTWYDWNLILTSKDITPPEPKTNYVELDGMNGTIDLTEVLTGEVTYKDRTITASFWTDYGTRKERESLIRTIISSLHGKKIKIVEPDDPDHYYYGRVKVKSYTNILSYATITIEAVCEPWRYTDDIKRPITVNSNETIDLVITNNGVKTICPEINLSTGSVTLIYGNSEIELKTPSSYKLSDIKLRRGVNIIGIYGNGSVTFTYKEADL